MINVKSEREGWKRLRLPQRLSSSGLLANFYPNISSAPLIQSVVGLVLAVGSNKLDFYFPHNGPRGPPPALRQNHCNTFLLHNHFQYSAKKLNLHFVLLYHSLNEGERLLQNLSRCIILTNALQRIKFCAILNFAILCDTCNSFLAAMPILTSPSTSLSCSHGGGGGCSPIRSFILLQIKFQACFDFHIV